jgi:hypothetical protein
LLHPIQEIHGDLSHLANQAFQVNLLPPEDLDYREDQLVHLLQILHPFQGVQSNLAVLKGLWDLPDLDLQAHLSRLEIPEDLEDQAGLEYLLVQLDLPELAKTETDPAQDLYLHSLAR